MILGFDAANTPLRALNGEYAVMSVPAGPPQARDETFPKGMCSCALSSVELRGRGVWHHPQQLDAEGLITAPKCLVAQIHRAIDAAEYSRKGRLRPSQTTRKTKANCDDVTALVLLVTVVCLELADRQAVDQVAAVDRTVGRMQSPLPAVPFVLVLFSCRLCFPVLLISRSAPSRSRTAHW